MTTVVGSYPLPGWLEYSSSHLEEFGPDDVREMQDDAVQVAIMDQTHAGLDVITDGEQSRFDFNLSFYAYLDGIEREDRPGRRYGPPAHDQRGRHRITGELAAPRGFGVVEEFERLTRLAPDGPLLKASIPGPYTLAGRVIPNGDYPDRYAVTEALIPLIRDELVRLIETGCAVVTLDEPSMSCYAHREDPARFVDIFNRTVAPIRGKCYVGSHLCFGNYKGRAVAPRSYEPLFPHFLDLDVDEIHLEMASREFAELEVISQIVERMDVGIGVIDVKNYHIEAPEDVVGRIQKCLQHGPAERINVSPDCGLSQTARWASRQKLSNMVTGARQAREGMT